ncbi:hypothetical protein MRX96_008160 [Rhipicephalus microplus]
MAPAVNQADAGSKAPRYFLRSHARQVSQEHVADKRKLEARWKSSGKMRRLGSPPSRPIPRGIRRQPFPASIAARDCLTVGGHLSYNIPSGQPCC